ncbi:hypothetical protein C4580_05635 [Candidatus Woesearchaeota archaeon]|nr:MAG: hypothetical protein C4580_05635 [Candidatus Woesearchaeota archaeon]
MARGEFEKDLDEYLHARKRSGINIKALLDRLTPKPKPKPIAIPEQVEVYDKQSEPKENFVQKLFKREQKQDASLLQAELRAEDAISDMKEMAKISLGMLRQLPDDQLKTFKNSSDFERLKVILKKHELIK